MTNDKVTVLICGGGSGAHVMAGLASSRDNVEVRVLTLYGMEADRWNATMKNHDFFVHLKHEGEEVGQTKTKPSLVTKDPAIAVQGCDLITLIVPAFAHEVYLQALAPYITPDMILVGLPGHAGFDFAVRSSLGEKAKQVTVMNTETLPWTCQIKEFGKRAVVLGTKDMMVGAMQIGNPKPARDPVGMLQQVLGPKPRLSIHGHLLGISLQGPTSYVHPCILYGRWAGWDGRSLIAPPLFYCDVSDDTVKLLSAVSEEVVNLSKVISSNCNVDMSNVCPIYDWYMRSYEVDIVDKSDLKSALTTNRAYWGVMHPMSRTNDGYFVPHFGYRYCAEDVPYGMLVIKGIAEIVGISTPNIDKVILWAQRVTNKEYLVGEKNEVKGKDISQTRAPQKYGLVTLESIILGC